jgi:hypothetical protein|tara:strand:- start:1355 stop:1531 length:177 start_codon:yes stop_codon:yes gene_type:complete
VDKIKKLSENEWLLVYTSNNYIKKTKEVHINFDVSKMNQMGIWNVSDDNLRDLTNDKK